MGVSPRITCTSNPLRHPPPPEPSLHPPSPRGFGGWREGSNSQFVPSFSDNVSERFRGRCRSIRVIASAAKQSRSGEGSLDCFAALAMTWRESAISRRMASEFCQESFAQIKKGHRECRVRDAPAASRANKIKHTSTSPQVHRNSPAFPARWFYRFLHALLGDRAFLPPSSHGSSAKLDASVGASGPHGFAVRSRAVRLPARSRPPHPVPRY